MQTELDLVEGMQFIDFDDAGTKTYQVCQPFVLDKEEAIYGLGQLQNGKMCIRDRLDTDYGCLFGVIVFGM